MKKLIAIFLCFVALCALTLPVLAAQPPEFITKTLPEGRVDEEYYVKIETTDPSAVFELYKDGKENNFNQSGLVLTYEGVIEGSPTKAGIYTFTVTAEGEGGKRYMTYTLTIKEAIPETTAPAEETVAPTEKATEPAETEAPIITVGADDPDNGKGEGNVPLWLLVTLGGLILCAVVVIILLVTKKKA